MTTHNLVPRKWVLPITLVGALGMTTVVLSAPAENAERVTSTPGLAPVSMKSPVVRIVEPPFQPPTTWAYQPASLTVKVGTRVTWINTGAVVHTVTSDEGKALNSGDIQPKKRFSFEAKAPGTFTYHCMYHPWMKGRIVVVR